MAADPDQIMSQHPTVAGKIRALAAAGFSRAEIARRVQRSYQQVRQVLVDEERRRARMTTPAGMAETPPPPFLQDVAFLLLPTERLVLDDAGGLSLPPKFLSAIGCSPGETVLALANEDGTITVMNKEAVDRRLRELAPSAPSSPLASDQLIAERRAEARRERDEEDETPKRRDV